MSKYIKLEDAIHNINLEVTGRKEYTGDMKANLFFALDELPTIDIVHCGECRYWHRYIDLITQGRCEASDVLHGFPSTPVNSTTEDFYCKYGERI